MKNLKERAERAAASSLGLSKRTLNAITREVQGTYLIRCHISVWDIYTHFPTTDRIGLLNSVSMESARAVSTTLVENGFYALPALRKLKYTVGRNGRARFLTEIATTDLTEKQGVQWQEFIFKMSSHGVILIEDLYITMSNSEDAFIRYGVSSNQYKLINCVLEKSKLPLLGSPSALKPSQKKASEKVEPLSSYNFFYVTHEKALLI